MIDQAVIDLRSDFEDEGGVDILTEAKATRLLERALPLFCQDVDAAFVLDEGDVVPEMTAELRELWILRASIAACSSLMASAARLHGWKSGDSSADRSKESDHWKELMKQLKADYTARVLRVNPSFDVNVVSIDTPVALSVRGSRRRRCR